MMGKWFKRKRKSQKVSTFFKEMLKPVLLPVIIAIDATLEGWKLVMVAKLKLADPQKFIGIFSDSVDELRENIKSQIKKVIGE